MSTTTRSSRTASGATTAEPRVPASTRAIAVLVTALGARAGAPRPQEARYLKAAGCRERFLLPLARRFPRLLLALADRRVPGTAAHLAWRKAAFWHAANATPDHGRCTILGAGLDGLPERLAHARPDLRITEHDVAAVLEVKRRAYGRHQPSNLRSISRDLAQLASGAAPLWPNGRGPSRVLAEGLCMYLPRTRVADLLKELHDTPATTIVFSCLDRAALADPATPIGRLRGLLAARGESFTWGLTTEEVGPWLTTCGYELLSVELPPAPYGEFLVTARNRRQNPIE